jgi:hypothetical protein
MRFRRQLLISPGTFASREASTRTIVLRFHSSRSNSGTFYDASSRNAHSRPRWPRLSGNRRRCASGLRAFRGLNGEVETAAPSPATASVKAQVFEVASGRFCGFQARKGAPLRGGQSPVQKNPEPHRPAERGHLPRAARTISSRRRVVTQGDIERGLFVIDRKRWRKRARPRAQASRAR